MWGTDYAVRVANGTTAETYVGSGTIDIAQVQLCAGDVALPFMPKSVDDEERECKRYCYGIITTAAAENIAFGCAASTTVAYVNIFLPVQMRIVPTLIATAEDWQLDDGVNAPIDVTALTIDDLTFSSNKMVTLKVSVASGLTANRPYYLVGDGTTGRILILSAEF
jgi:hypothetical protein